MLFFGTLVGYKIATLLNREVELEDCYTIEEAPPELTEEDNPFPVVNYEGMGLTCQLVAPWGQIFEISFDAIEWQMITTVALMADEEVTEVIVDILAERTEDFGEQAF